MKRFSKRAFLICVDKLVAIKINSFGSSFLGNNGRPVNETFWFVFAGTNLAEIAMVVDFLLFPAKMFEIETFLVVATMRTDQLVLDVCFGFMDCSPHRRKINFGTLVLIVSWRDFCVACELFIAVVVEPNKRFESQTTFILGATSNAITAIHSSFFPRNTSGFNIGDGVVRDELLELLLDAVLGFFLESLEPILKLLLSIKLAICLGFLGTAGRRFRKSHFFREDFF